MEQKEALKYLKGVGPKREELFKNELGIRNFSDLLGLYPFRYEDRTKIYKISEITGNEEIIQVRGIIREFVPSGFNKRQRLNASFYDDKQQWLKQ